MPVYKYTATANSGEDHYESGTVVATSEQDATKKLRALRLNRINLRKLSGVRALFKQFTANIR